MKEGNIQVTGAEVRNIHPLVTQTLVDDMFPLQLSVLSGAVSSDVHSHFFSKQTLDESSECLSSSSVC